MTMTTARIYFTGDVTKPDGSDTNFYGDETEPGAGSTVESGWIDPDWSLYDVFESRDDVRHIAYDPDDDETLDAWRERVLSEYLGAYEDNGDGTYYATDTPVTRESIEHGYEVHLAAHVRVGG